MRLIDADALMDEIESWYNWIGETMKPSEEITRNVLSSVMDNINEAPTIEAEPVRHGRWVDGMPYINSHWKVCSVCHKSADHPYGDHEYCGRCGAKMDAKDIDVHTTQMDGGAEDE